LNASRTSGNGTTGSGGGVRAFDRSRSLQIEGPSNKFGGRGSDRKADAHARYGKWIALASEHEHALAASDSDNEPALGEDDCNLAGFSSGWSTDASHAHDQGNQGSAYAKLFHAFFL
jgi:hypothetical protein